MVFGTKPKYKEYIANALIDIISDTLEENAIESSAFQAHMKFEEQKGGGYCDASAILGYMASLDEKYDALGLILGKSVILEDLGLLGYAVRSAKTVQEGIDMDEKFLPYLTSLVSITSTIGETNTEINIELSPLGGLYEKFIVEFLCSSLYSSCSQMCPGINIDANVSVRFENTTSLNVYEDNLAGASFKFNQLKNSIFIPNKITQSRPHFQDQNLSKMMSGLLSGFMNLLPKRNNIISQIEHYLYNNICYTKSDIANLLHMTDRTLDRKLVSENIKFKIIKDKVLYNLSIEMLKDSDRHHRKNIVEPRIS